MSKHLFLCNPILAQSSAEDLKVISFPSFLEVHSITTYVSRQNVSRWVGGQSNFYVESIDIPSVKGSVNTVVEFHGGAGEIQ